MKLCEEGEYYLLDRGPEGFIEGWAETIGAGACLWVHLEEGQFDLIFGEMCVKGVKTRYGVRIDRREIKRPSRGDSGADERDKKISQDVSAFW